MANIYVFTGIITVFLILGFTLPFINEAFGETSTSTANIEGLKDGLGQEMQQVNALGITDIIFSIFTIWFWTFGALPVWFDLLILTPMRIVLAYIIVDLLWIG